MKQTFSKFEKDKLRYFIISTDNVHIVRSKETKDVVGLWAEMLIKSPITYEAKDWENLNRAEYAKKYEKELAELVRKVIWSNTDVNLYRIDVDEISYIKMKPSLEKNTISFLFKLNEPIDYNTSMFLLHKKPTEPDVDLENKETDRQKFYARTVSQNIKFVEKTTVKEVKEEKPTTKEETKEVVVNSKRKRTVKKTAEEKIKEAADLGIDRVLLLTPHWGMSILENGKVWEIRNKPCKFRGKFGISYSGTSKIYGTAELVDSFELTKELYEQNFNKHLINCKYEDLPDNYKYVWVLKDAVKLKEPVSFVRKKGAIIWQRLE